MEAEAKDKNRMLQSGFPEVLVHGPYGKLSLDLKQYSALVLVAGGIGFTPLANTLGHILAGRASGGGLGLPGGRYPRLEAPQRLVPRGILTRPTRGGMLV